MKRLLFGLALFVALITCGGYAFAASGGAVQQPWNTIIYGPVKSGGILDQPVYNEVGVCAFGRYDAAMVALGYDGATIDGLSADVKAKLSNQSTGGDFWTFAQKFTMPSDDDWSATGIYWRSYQDLYGAGNVWRGSYTDGDATNAMRDADVIIGGGDLGGGGGDVTADILFTPFDGVKYSPTALVPKSWKETIVYYNSSLNKFYGKAYASSDSELAGSFTLGITQSSLDYIKSLFDDTYKYCMLGVQHTSGNTYDIFGIIIDDISNLTDYKIGDNLVDFHYTGTALVLNSMTINISNVTWPDNPVDMALTIKSTRNLSSYSTRNYNNTPVFGTYTMAYCIFGKDGYVGGSPAGPVPPSNWPESPTVTAPTAPDVPEPEMPTMEPQPSAPTSPTLPIYPVDTIYPDVDYDTADLQAVLDALNEHCEHLQSAVYQGFADFFDTFTPWLSQEMATLRACIRGESEWQMTVLETQLEDLQDYLWQICQWLASQMQFTFTGGDYDDSSVVRWLMRIYYKLQSSPVNTRPQDPVSDSDGAWDWLGQFIADLLARISEGASDLASRLLGLFDDIKDKFPFSIPWDMAAVLALFDVPAQTPAFVVNFEVFGTPVTFDIDLHFMDAYAETIRAMESILFCFYLLFKTQWLSGVFDDLGSYMGGKLGYKEG